MKRYFVALTNAFQNRRFFRAHRNDLVLLVTSLLMLIVASLTKPAAIGYAVSKLLDSELAGVVVGGRWGEGWVISEES